MAVFNFIAAWEPLYLLPKAGSDGFTIIGLSHTVQGDEIETGKLLIDGDVVDWKKGISKQQAIDLLSQDLQKYDFEIDERVQVDLNLNKRIALLSLLYNFGSRAVVILDAINNLRTDEVATEFMKFAPLGDSREAEIRRRRQAEIKLWNTPQQSTIPLEADSGGRSKSYDYFFKEHPKARVDAINFFSRWETLYLQPRIWPDGSAAIGFNHYLKTQELSSGMLWITGSAVDWRKGITDQQAIDLLIQDLERANCKASRLISKKLNPKQKLSILSFVYNLGIDAFERSTLRKKINQGRFEDVPAAFMIWGKEAGLGPRRQAEIDLWNALP